MVVHEVDIAAVGFEELFRRDEETEILIEGEFFAGEGVDEGTDEFEEGVEEPGDCFVLVKKKRGGRGCGVC